MPGIRFVTMQFDVIASGYGLVEGPTIAPDGGVYFSDVLGGGVYRAEPSGAIDTVVPKRRGVGGIAVHADGGVVCSGRDIVRVHDGETTTLFTADGILGWNDLCTDAQGRVYAGALRFAVFDRDATAGARRVLAHRRTGRRDGAVRRRRARQRHRALARRSHAVPLRHALRARSSCTR